MSEQGCPKRTKAEVPSVNPVPGYCSYYVLRKHRFCKTTCRDGSPYCSTHASERDSRAASLEGAKDVRVACPINPNHTVYASRLAHHVTVCPDLRHITAGLPYHREDVHALKGRPRYCTARAEEEEAAALRAERSALKDMPSEELEALKARIRESYETYIKAQFITLPAVGKEEEGAAGRGEDGAEASKKHGPQHRALLQGVDYAIAQTLTAPQERLGGFMELGAGKGGLSVALQETLIQRRGDEPTPPSDSAAPPLLPHLRSRTVAQPHIVVVDMGGFRRKGDARVSHSDIPLLRLRINLKDLDMTTAIQEEVRPASRAGAEAQNWMALGKHLCGSCTDFALSCVTEPDLESVARAKVRGVVLATCCHHRCELQHLNYVQPFSAPRADASGPPFALQLPGTPYVVSEREFGAIVKMTSWAVSGKFADEAKQQMGFYCKRVIDMWRVGYLRECGYKAFLSVYATRDITEENV
ncbi:tRNA guanosine-2'-O-methyltransferase TRM13 [Strigomonas culicis]|uniref:tRNA:m(4)X modification enzyme TRM13 n=1 Tax=Strigomonas culicis TaxID=28005 RepID=S9V8Y6_9TRYP|nr:tRNA guanosine-2'-O-methyltransferase TRM13 [Strigomonas culicis]|eukprot:EPY37263.1 tRNA guanosine-2'-O-methyltransferase TRM13 [Strigomonas culicis]